jgi:hypothetical protein
MVVCSHGSPFPWPRSEHRSRVLRGNAGGRDAHPRNRLQASCVWRRWCIVPVHPFRWGMHDATRTHASFSCNPATGCVRGLTRMAGVDAGCGHRRNACCWDPAGSRAVPGCRCRTAAGTRRLIGLLVGWRGCVGLGLLLMGLGRSRLLHGQASGHVAPAPSPPPPLQTPDASRGNSTSTSTSTSYSWLSGGPGHGYK